MKLWRVTFHCPYRTNMNSGFCFIAATTKEQAMRACLGNNDHIWIENITQVKAQLVKQTMSAPR